MNPLLGSLDCVIGGTPLVEIDFSRRGKRVRLFAKAEFVNLTGSVKDRVALYILSQAYENGELAPGDTIVEASSGNTAISFAVLGRALGHPVRIYIPDWLSRERFLLLEMAGAETVKVSREEGGFEGAIQMTQSYRPPAGRPFLPRQFSNPANVEAHKKGTAAEIERQLFALGLTPDALVAGVGTGGTVTGCAARCRETRSRCRCYPLEPANSPVLSTGKGGAGHRIQGIGDQFIPDILDMSILEKPLSVWDGDAIIMAQKLGRAGLPVGISSGANIVGALMAAETLGEDAVVVTLLCDCVKKYLSTDLVREEPVKEGYVSPGVEVEGFCFHPYRA